MIVACCEGGAGQAGHEGWRGSAGLLPITAHYCQESGSGGSGVQQQRSLLVEVALFWRHVVSRDGRWAMGASRRRRPCAVLVTTSPFGAKRCFGEGHFLLFVAHPTCLPVATPLPTLTVSLLWA